MLYKSVTIDIDQNISFKELNEVLYLNGSTFLTEINLLDEYRGTSIPSDHTSLCLQLTFQSNEKTLQNKEIENTINNLQSLLTTKFKAKIRT